MGEKQSQCLPLFLTSHSSKQYFYNLLENRYQTRYIRILTKKAILGSFYGWLVLLDPNNGDCCLWNPTLNQTIQIPQLEDPHIYKRCILSKPPTDPDCLIVFSSKFYTENLVYKIGDNTSFKFFSDDGGYRFIAMVSFRGMIYVLVHWLDILKWIWPWDFVTIHMAGDRLETKLVHIKGGLPYDVYAVSSNRSYLIKSPCDNELLMITKTLSNAHLESRVLFKVYRVDVSRTQQLEEVYNIDGRTIFISEYGNGFCLSSESFSGAIKPNSIYYTNSNGKVIYIYDLDDRSTVTLLPYPDVDINPYTAVNFWVDFPDILNCSEV